MSRSTLPPVSVVVPNYNHGKFLPRRLDSILGQTHQDFELIILDDASTDNSREVMSAYAQDARVIYIAAEQNSGSPFIQWNRGVTAARYNWIWIAESDDFADEQLLATLLRRAAERPNIALSYCQSWRVDETGQTNGTMAENWDSDFEPDRWRSDYTNDGGAECANYLIWKNTIPNASAVIFRRDVYLKAGGAPEAMRLCGDWMTWSRLLRHGGVAYCANPLNYFRQHGNSVRASTAWQKHLLEQWSTQVSILAWCQVPATMKRRLARRTAGEMLDQVLPAPRQQKLQTLRACVRCGGPLLAASPWEAARTIVSRLIGRGNRAVHAAKNVS